jgi:hypothetical protein
VQEARGDPAGAVAHDLQLAVQDLRAAVLRQRRDAVRRQLLAILARPSFGRLPGGLGHVEQGEIAACATDHGMTVDHRALDQPATHEPGIQQQPHVAEPLAE